MVVLLDYSVCEIQQIPLHLNGNIYKLENF